MGVLNVTPDSFSDGGRFLDPELAVKHGRQLVHEGADLVDVGGESTRPGATRPGVQEELDRVLPVIEQLAAEGVLVSVDTMRASVAEAAVSAGAVLVNDVSGGRADADMLGTVARLGAAYVLMHWRAHSVEMHEHTAYDDVVADVAAELQTQLDEALRQGIDADRIALDPGIGFSKTADQNWDVLAATEQLHRLGQPVLVATSRKRFLGTLLAGADGSPRPPHLREDATTATSALAATAGAWCIRTHSVRATRDAVEVAHRWAGARAGRPRVSDVEEVEAANAAFYAAFETADLDAMRALWLEHPGDAVRPPGRAPGPGHAGDQPLLGADHGEHAVHPVLPHRRRDQRPDGTSPRSPAPRTCSPATRAPASTSSAAPGRSPRMCSFAQRRAGGCGSTMPPRYCQARTMTTEQCTTGSTGCRRASRPSGTTESSTSSGATARLFGVDLLLGMDTRPAAASDELAGHRRLRNARGEGEAGDRDRPGRPHRDACAADRGRLSGRRTGAAGRK